MQVPTLRAVHSLLVGLRVDVGLGLAEVVVEPVSDVCTCCQHNRVAKRTVRVLSDQLAQVEDLVEERDPAIVARVVLRQLAGQVVAPQLVERRRVFEVLLGRGIWRPA